VMQGLYRRVKLEVVAVEHALVVGGVHRDVGVLREQTPAQLLEHGPRHSLDRISRAEEALPVVAGVVVPEGADEQLAHLRHEVHDRVARLQAVVVALRTMRAEHEVHPRVTLDVELRTSDARIAETLSHEQAAIGALCNARVVMSAATGDPPDDRAVAVAEGVTVLVPLAQLVDPEKERVRLERDLKKLGSDIESTQKKLGNAGFVERAPAAIVAEERSRLETMIATKARLEAALRKHKS